MTTAVSGEASTRASADTSLAAAVDAAGGGGSPNWADKVIVTWGDGDPDIGWGIPKAQTSPTLITTSKALLSYFRPKVAITIDKIKALGIAAQTGIFKMAIYKASDLSRLTAELTFNTTALGVDVVTTGLGLTLDADELYIAALAVTSAASSTNSICVINNGFMGTATAPQSYSGYIDLDSGYLNVSAAKVTISGGTLPSTLGTPEAINSTSVQAPFFILEAA